MITNPKIAVFGGGSWATAIVKMLCENMDQVGWYMRNQTAIDYIKENEHNPNYLSSAALDVKKLYLSNDMNDMVRYGDILIFAIPSAFLKEELDKITQSISSKIVFSAIKGIVPESGLIVGEHFNKFFKIPFKNIGVIAGPCHAEEVAMERLSYLTIACKDAEKADLLSKYLHQNIFAIAAGMAHGLGYGDNFQAVLMSNSVREMKRFIRKVHRMKRNINNSAYLGDLLVTGYSVFSRNRMFGNMIGKGYTVKSAMMEMSMVAEGYYATKSAFLINEKNKAKTPIIDAVYGILYENKNPKQIFKELTDVLD